MTKQPTGGTLAISGKEFRCNVEDSKEEIAVKNPTLTTAELDQVFAITRERKDDPVYEYADDSEIE